MKKLFNYIFDKKGNWSYITLLNFRNKKIGGLSIRFEIYDDDETIYTFEPAVIYDFYSDIKNKGYGTRILKKSEEYIRDLGIDTVVLMVCINNVNAIRLYERLGYFKIKSNDTYFTYQKTLIK